MLGERAVGIQGDVSNMDDLEQLYKIYENKKSSYMRSNQKMETYVVSIFLFMFLLIFILKRIAR